MRKTLFFATLVTALAVISAVSCKKKDENPVGNYTCTCIITTAGVTDTVVLPENNIAKNSAQSACTQAESTYNTSGATATCTFK